jgi:ABC-type taurine transport system ATPase subunit
VPLLALAAERLAAGVADPRGAAVAADAADDGRDLGLAAHARAVSLASQGRRGLAVRVVHAVLVEAAELDADETLFPHASFYRTGIAAAKPRRPHVDAPRTPTGTAKECVIAKGIKTGGRDFPKGVSGNPNGRPPAPEDVRAVRRLTQPEIERIANDLLEKTRDELTEILEDPRTPTKVAMFARLIRSATWSADHKRMAFLLDRVVGKVETTVRAGEGAEGGLAPSTEIAPAEKTFEEFVTAADYPAPFPKQVEMMHFGIEETGTHMLLGARGYGKTDYVTILGAGYRIYRDPQYRVLIVSKSQERNAAMVAEVAKALRANGIAVETENSKCLRVVGLHGKDHSVSTITVGAKSARGRHPDLVLMDDPVTEEDVSEATRKKVQRLYNEVTKLTPNVLIIGQPAHKYDLYETLRPLLKEQLKLLEVPHGSIPELDHDLEAQRLAGVSEESIQASYFLKVISEASSPFERVKYIDHFPVGDSVAFIDPSFEGGDYTALSIVRAHFDGVVVQGHVFKKAWNHCLEEMAARMKECQVRRLCFETNSLGDQPITLLRQVLQGIGVVGKKSTSNKHSRIMAAGPFAHLIHLSKTSDRIYLEHVVKYEYGAKFDDAPDSLASCLEWLGLIRGRGKA